MIKNHEKVINYSASKGEEMDITIVDGKCHFRENLYDWARAFHEGWKVSCNVAGTQQFTDDSEAFTLSDSEEVDSLEKFWNRKRIKILRR